MAERIRGTRTAVIRAGAVWSIPLAGRRAEIPATIDGVRALLTGQRLDGFDAAVADTPAKHIRYVPLEHALPADAASADPAAAARLRAGDFAGVLDHDGSPVTPFDPSPAEGEQAARVWRVDEYDGTVPTEFPATVAGIRAALQGQRRAEFVREIGRTAGQDLPVVLFRWSYPAEQRAKDEAASDRLAAEDHASCRITVTGRIRHPRSAVPQPQEPRTLGHALSRWAASPGAPDRRCGGEAASRSHEKGPTERRPGESATASGPVRFRNGVDQEEFT
ncbi:hypothetical protein [Streptomyces jumonjinensis]|uniref:hypothetical protein n=1 Tax=Streptomyces jumonjinensis TaxID=1945 RepID=UPI0037AB65B6